MYKTRDTFEINEKEKVGLNNKMKALRIASAKCSRNIRIKGGCLGILKQPLSIKAISNNNDNLML